MARELTRRVPTAAKAVAAVALLLFVIEALSALAAEPSAVKWDATTIMRFVIPGIVACAIGSWHFIAWASARHDAERRAMTDEELAEHDNDRAW